MSTTTEPDLADAVTRFVTDHRGCTLGELAAAMPAGRAAVGKVRDHLVKYGVLACKRDGRHLGHYVLGAELARAQADAVQAADAYQRATEARGEWISLALDAHWSKARIAGELGISPQRVSQFAKTHTTRNGGHIA